MSIRPHGTPARYSHGPDHNGQPGRGCRCTPCTRACTRARTWRDYKTRSEGPGTADATGTRRRLQALMAAGWSRTILVARLGMTERHVRLILHGSERVLAMTATRVAGLYDELWDQPPPAGTQRERQAATLARNYAREHGWVMPLAWDEEPGPHCIDDPAARPAPGWKRQETAA